MSALGRALTTRHDEIVRQCAKVASESDPALALPNSAGARQTQAAIQMRHQIVEAILSLQHKPEI